MKFAGFFSAIEYKFISLKTEVSTQKSNLTLGYTQT